MSGVALVQFSSAAVDKLIKLGRMGLDCNLAEAADSAGHSPPLHHMLCVVNIKSPGAKSAHELKPYLNLFHAGFFIAVVESASAEILELCGMSALKVEACGTADVLFVAGTLSQWRDALLRGCQREVSRTARHVFNLVYTELKNIGISAAFHFESRDNSDETFTLEAK